MLGTPIPVKDMIEKVRFLSSLLRNEHMHNYDDLSEETILETMGFFFRRGYIYLSADKSTITIRHKDFLSVIRFFGDVI